MKETPAQKRARIIEQQAAREKEVQREAPQTPGPRAAKPRSRFVGWPARGARKPAAG
jgi:hypothetical protein